MKLQVIVSNEFAKQIDSFCAKFGYQRSEFIRNCIRSEIFSQTLESVGVGRDEITPVTAQLYQKKIKEKNLTSETAREVKKVAQEKNIDFCKHGAAYKGFKISRELVEAI